MSERDQNCDQPVTGVTLDQDIAADLAELHDLVTAEAERALAPLAAKLAGSGGKPEYATVVWAAVSDLALSYAKKASADAA
jgi:hypothetical protein